MNPHHSKHRPLFFNPRSPWGGRLESHSFRRHMRAHEDSRELPEEDKDGRFQGRIESSGETHGKPENSFEFQVNSNPHFRDTSQDPLADTRRGYDPHMAELERQRARLIKERERQKKAAAQAAQQRR